MCLYTVLYSYKNIWYTEVHEHATDVRKVLCTVLYMNVEDNPKSIFHV